MVLLLKLKNSKKGTKRFIPLMLVAALAAAPLALAATGVTPATSASATVPSVKGEAKCNTETGKYDITWIVSGDTSYPDETATIVSQSRATSPTLVDSTVKNTSSVTGSESVSAAGTYTLEVKVQWTNHAKGDLVTQQGSVNVSGDCVVPTAPTPPPTQTVNCEVISANYNRPLKNGDHINATITPPGSQVNMYVDQNIAGGASYNGQNNLGLRWKILGVEQTPIPLTLEQVMAGVITLPYGAELQKTQSGWTVSFVQTNETDTWPEYECSFTPVEPPATITEFAAVTAVDKCGVENDALNIPEDTDQVAYEVVTDTRVDGVGSVTVKAVAKTEAQFANDAVTSWTFEFTNEACESTPPVEPPTIIDEYEPVRATDNCGIENDYLDIPRDTYALTYTITNDTRVNGVGSVTTELTAKAGFALPKGAITSWTFEFTNEACESTPPVEPPTTEPPVVIPPVVTPPTETPEPPVVVPPTETPKPTPPVVTPEPSETPKPSPQPTVKPEPSETPKPTATPTAATVPAKPASPTTPTTLASTGVEAGTAGFGALALFVLGGLAIGATAFKRRHRKVTNE